MESHYTLAKKDVLRFVGLLMALGAVIGVGIGAMVFSGSQRTVTARASQTLSFLFYCQRTASPKTLFHSRSIAIILG
jgi:hypothetical protein